MRSTVAHGSLLFVTFDGPVTPTYSRTARRHVTFHKRRKAASASANGNGARRRHDLATNELGHAEQVAAASESESVSNQPEDESRSIVARRPDDLDQNEELSVAFPDMALRLGGGRKDPFISYPESLSPRAWMLLDVLLDDSIRCLRSFRCIWYPVLSTSHPGAWYMILSTAATILTKAQAWLKPALEIEANYCYAKALHFAQTCIDDPAECSSDGLIATVAAFACSSRINTELDLWQAHIHGLRRIVDSRGGIESVKDPSVRFTIFVADTSGACVRDVRPTFPLPEHILPDWEPLRSRPELQPSKDVEVEVTNWRAWFPRRNAIIQILRDVAIASKWVTEQAARNPSFFEPSNTSGRWVLPPIHRCLELIPEHDTEAVYDPGHDLQEVLRQGIILYLQRFRRNWGVITGSTRFRVQKFREALLRSLHQWNSLPYMLLWVVVVGGVEATETSDQIWFATLLATHPQLAQLSADEMSIRLHQFIWVDQLFESTRLRLMSQVGLVREQRRSRETS